ncbi:MAG: cupin domain-containing protein [Chloroflexota bacterium]
MTEIFPNAIRNLPHAQHNFPKTDVFLSQSDSHQILFLQSQEDYVIEEHRNQAEWCIVLEGKIEITMQGNTQGFEKGECYFVPADISHWANVYAGFVGIVFFDDPKRFQPAE